MIRRPSALSLLQVLRVAIYALAGALVLLAVAAVAAPALQAQTDGALPGQLKISANQSIYVIGRGNQATGTLTTTSCCGFDDNVYLSASGLPSGSTMSSLSASSPPPAMVLPRWSSRWASTLSRAPIRLRSSRRVAA